MARSLEEIIKDISALVNEFNELEEVEAPEGSIPIGVDFAIVFDVSRSPLLMGKLLLKPAGFARR